MIANQVLIFGECLYDIFPDGQAILGGAPFNVAWHLQGFGLAPLFISRVGDDPLGHRLRKEMLDWGMSTQGLQLDTSHRTGEVRVSLKDGQPSYDILADRAWDFIEAHALPPLNPSLIYHGSLGLRSETSAQTFAALSSQHQTPHYFDINLRPPFWSHEQIHSLMDSCRWLKLNDEEIAQLEVDGTDLETKARGLLERYKHLEWLLLTRGAAGAWLFDREGQRHDIEPETDIQLVDAVGAGDAFTAVTILGILHHWSIPLMLRRAQAFAGQILGQQGAIGRDRGLYDCLRKLWGL